MRRREIKLDALVTSCAGRPAITLRCNFPTCRLVTLRHQLCIYTTQRIIFAFKLHPSVNRILFSFQVIKKKL